MQKLLMCAVALGFVVAVPGRTLGQTPPPQSAAPKAEAKATPSVAGTWTVSLQSPNGSFAATLELKLDEKEPKKVTGTMASEMGTASVYGEFADGTLAFAISPDGSTEIWFTGAFQEDGSLAGTLDARGNQIPWTATRVKDK